MKTASSRCLFAFLFLGLTLALASSSPAGAQSSQVTAPKPKPVEIITCSAGLRACGCMGGEDCSTLKKFAAAGGCSNLKCTGETPNICVCDLDAMHAGPVFTAARQHNLLKRNPLDKLAAPTKPVRDCTATATCGGTTVSCSVKGSGACQGANGTGVSCTQFLADGGEETTTSECGE